MLTHTSHTGSLGCPCSRHRRNTLQQLHYSHTESLQDKQKNLENAKNNYYSTKKITPAFLAGDEITRYNCMYRLFHNHKGCMVYITLTLGPAAEGESNINYTAR